MEESVIKKFGYTPQYHVNEYISDFVNSSFLVKKIEHIPTHGKIEIDNIPNSKEGRIEAIARVTATKF
jgi:hypothetical protein